MSCLPLLLLLLIAAADQQLLRYQVFIFPFFSSFWNTRNILLLLFPLARNLHPSASPFPVTISPVLSCFSAATRSVNSVLLFYYFPLKSSSGSLCSSSLSTVSNDTNLCTGFFISNFPALRSSSLHHPSSRTISAPCQALQSYNFRTKMN